MARYIVKVTEKLDAYIYMEVQADNDDEALEKARDQAFSTPLNLWTITDEDGDMQYDKEQWEGEKCDNCGKIQQNCHTVQWESTGEVELYCDNCHRAN